jgi:hypothetical protein
MTDTQAAEQGAEVAGRVGLVSRGVVYCVLAIVALQVAFGDRNQEVDRQGALRAVARQPFGAVLLGVLTVGFAAYALWRFAAAALGDEQAGKRLLHAAKGALYAVFTVTSARLVLGRSSGSGGSDEQAKTWSARFMDHTGGRPIVVLVGLGLVVAGGVLAWRGARRKFEKHLRTGEMHGWQRTWLPRLGTIGHAARGVVLALVGVFLVRAAIRFDPDEAVGVDGALHQLAARPFGATMLAVVALGLACYGLFSFVEARWRAVRP